MLSVRDLGGLQTDPACVYVFGQSPKPLDPEGPDGTGSSTPGHEMTLPVPGRQRQSRRVGLGERKSRLRPASYQNFHQGLSLCPFMLMFSRRVKMRWQMLPSSSRLPQGMVVSSLMAWVT